MTAASAEVKAEAVRLLGLSGDDAAAVELVQLPNGATGLTFGLKRGGADAPYTHVVRQLRGDGDTALLAVTKALSDMGAGAKYVASSDTVLIVAFVPDAASPTVPQLSDRTPALEATAQLLAKLHSVKTATLGGAVKDGGASELQMWLGKAAALHTTDDKKELMAAVTAEVAAAEPYVARARAAAPLAPWLGGDAAGTPNAVLAHGDFHPNNVLLSDATGPVLVDLDGAALRPPAFDIAYFFQVWGDLHFTVPGRFAPSAAAPVPYAEAAARRDFVRAYIVARRAHADDSRERGLSETALDELTSSFVWEVEQVGYLERLRLLLVWLVIAGVATSGIGAQLYGGAVMFLPGVVASRRLLGEAQGDAAKQAAVVEHGLIVQGMVAASAPPLAPAAA